ncbi:L-histidine N(alpha)-methyltransferase [Actinospica robiniae]|uniref:L-histidine N(alpha)-methyltransferase n=1 Tax=Actinospica robiniae TaxID=304901 RepID=UPI000554C222|nr:L-histidine N(alpha)-methyltransferase [Actinospica robiniae]
MNDGVFVRLDRALQGGWDRWMLSLEREDPRAFLMEMVRALKGDPEDGTGKKIENKHRYIGLGPTIAWLLTSKDPSYPVAYDSIASFGRIWDDCQDALGNVPYHYVSLGVGTGDKDRHVIDRLQARNPQMLYVGLDISSAMLNLGTQETRLRIPGRTLLIELDFEERSSLSALSEFLDRFVEDEPILFSLLGNSLGNIEDDRGFLQTLAAVLRPQDRLALEVATATTLDKEAVRTVAAERSGSRLYNEFATAALAMYTDLTIDTNWLSYQASIDEDFAIRVEGYYINRSGADIPLMLPNREIVPYRAGEGIRVLLGRRYSPQGLQTLLGSAGLIDVAADRHRGAVPVWQSPDVQGFASTLMLLQRTETTSTVPIVPLARVWGQTTRVGE